LTPRGPRSPGGTRRTCRTTPGRAGGPRASGSPAGRTTPATLSRRPVSELPRGAWRARERSCRLGSRLGC